MSLLIFHQTVDKSTQTHTHTHPHRVTHTHKELAYLCEVAPMNVTKPCAPSNQPVLTNIASFAQNKYHHIEKSRKNDFDDWSDKLEHEGAKIILLAPLDPR